MLQKMDPQYVPTIQPPSKQSSRPPSGGPPNGSSGGSSSSGTSSGGHRSSTGGVVMSRVGMTPGTLSPGPLKKQITAPVSRHSSTATLESLQQQKNKSAY